MRSDVARVGWQTQCWECDTEGDSGCLYREVEGSSKHERSRCSESSMVSEVLEGARSNAAAGARSGCERWGLPDGQAWYAFNAKNSTTSSRTSEY